MRRHERGIVHAVELIAGEDQHLIDIPTLKQLLVLAHGIRCPLKPTRTCGGLLSGQNFNEPTAETSAEVVGQAEMAIERLAVELREHINFLNARVDAIADGDVNEAIAATQRDCRLGAGGGQGLQTRAGTAAKDDRKNILHVSISRFKR